MYCIRRGPNRPYICACSSLNYITYQLTAMKCRIPATNTPNITILTIRQSRASESRRHDITTKQAKTQNTKAPNIATQGVAIETCRQDVELDPKRTKAYDTIDTITTRQNKQSIATESRKKDIVTKLDKTYDSSTANRATPTKNIQKEKKTKTMESHLHVRQYTTNNIVKTITPIGKTKRVKGLGLVIHTRYKNTI